MVDVIQADRDAAAALLGYRDWSDATDYRLTGRQDRTVEQAVQSFAAHRIAATSTLQAQCERQREALERLVHDVDDLMGNSHGVTGLHLNGDVAPWSDLGEGGRFEPWLGEALADAREALSTPASLDKGGVDA